MPQITLSPLHPPSCLVMDMFTELEAVAWPASRLGEAIDMLAIEGKLYAGGAAALRGFPNLGTADNETFGRWIDIAAGELEIEAEPVDASYSGIDEFILNANPSLVRLPASFDTDESHFLAILQKGRWKQTLIGPDSSLHHLPRQLIREALCVDLEAPFHAAVDDFLTSLPETGEQKPRQALVHEMISRSDVATASVGQGWVLRPSPGVNIIDQIRYERLFGSLTISMIAIAVWQLLELASWMIIGKAAFQGHFEPAWFWAWLLVLVTISLVKMFVFDYQRKFFAGTGRIFRTLMLFGTLQLKPEEVRDQGAGQFLARVMEADTLESEGLFRGMDTFVAAATLLTGGVLLGLGAGGIIHALMLVGWIVVTAFMGWRYFRLGQAWLDTYRSMTNDLVERMVGHQTRLVQEHPDNWHTEEDQILNHYLQLSEQLNRSEAQLESLIPRGWLVVAIAGVAYPLTVGGVPPMEMALSVGGVLITFNAFNDLTRKLADFLQVLMTWDQVKPLVDAAKRSDHEPFFALPPRSDELEADQAIVTARQISFHYPGRTRLTLDSCNLDIFPGDRLLLEGASGGGKSTLATVISGLYPPTSGTLMLMGFDQRLVGTRMWRKRVVAVPQFQENHIITESLGFNLLMGYRWPPKPEDLAEAEEICRELGLGELIDEMPEGLDQRVGDGGWRLSHGERSRLYIVRALLQKPDLLILDESFGALDPENLQAAMTCVLKRAHTLLVIAHP